MILNIIMTIANLLQRKGIPPPYFYDEGPAGCFQILHLENQVTVAFLPFSLWHPHKTISCLTCQYTFKYAIV